MKKLFALAIVIVVIGLAWWGSGRSSQSFTFETKKVTEENETDRYVLGIEYPEFMGADKLAFVNADIQAFVATTTEAFVTQAKEITAWAIKNNVPGVGLEQGSSLYIRYEVATGTSAHVPVRLLVEEYNAGAAHPRHTVVTRNYDIKNQRILNLTDLFTDSMYLKTIAEYVKPALVKKFESEDILVDSAWITTGTEPKAENYEAWLATKDGLCIIFNEYQVAPYAYGIPEILIPWTELKNLKTF